MKKPGNDDQKPAQSTLYEIEYLKSVLSDDIPFLTVSIKNRVKQAIEERLMIDPLGFGKPLRYSLKGFRRLRVGDYRIVYQIKGKKVIIAAIKHRKDVYEEAL